MARCDNDHRPNDILFVSIVLKMRRVNGHMPENFCRCQLIHSSLFFHPDPIFSASMSTAIQPDQIVAQVKAYDGKIRLSITDGNISNFMRDHEQGLVSTYFDSNVHGF